MTVVDNLTHNVSAEELAYRFERLIADSSMLPITPQMLAETVLAKYDVTEKPEPPDPVGTIRVDDENRSGSVAIYIKVAQPDEWHAIYTSPDHPPSPLTPNRAKPAFQFGHEVYRP